MKNFQIIKKTLELNKLIGENNLGILSSGNASVRINNNEIAIKPSGIYYNKLKLKDITIVNFKGKIISGKKPSSDLDIHLKLYKSLKNLKSIIHTHSHYVTVFSILNNNLEVLSTLHADHFGDRIYCLPFVNHRTQNLAEVILKSIKKLPVAVILGNHGAFILTDNPDTAIDLAVSLEEVAKINYESILLSKLLNKNINTIKEDDIIKMHEYYVNKYGQR